VPVTGVPAAAWVGSPLKVACKSALGVPGAVFKVKGWVSVLLVLTGSVVRLLAVVVIKSGPVLGTVKVAVQVRAAPKGKRPLSGWGVQVGVVPTGKPDKAQLGFEAGVGPRFRQRPLTSTGCPGVLLAGTVVLACISASCAISTTICVLLFDKTGSAVLERVTPVTSVYSVPSGLAG
jgi:hypothetical protein